MPNYPTTTITITKKMITLRNLFYYIIIMANFVYLLVLYVISSGPFTEPAPGDPGNMVDYFFYGGLLFFVIFYIVNQRILIPKAQAIEEPFNRFGLHIVIIILGMDTPSIYGVIIGFVSLNATNSVNWTYVLVLFLWSFIYGIYFYLFHFQPTLAEIEVGKTIERRIRSRY